MLKSASFWKTEAHAPLLTLNNGFFAPNSVPPLTHWQRVAQWPSMLADGCKDVAATEAAAQRTLSDASARKNMVERIHTADAERTFKETANRVNFARFLAALQAQFGDYHQGLSYVASFICLSLSDAAAFALLCRMNDSARYARGYWRKEAVAFATDAYAFVALGADATRAATRMPAAVRDALQRHALPPETYAQKWFVGLCVHVLPFAALHRFFERFLAHGTPFLFHFGYALTRQLAAPLAATRAPHELLALLRLDAAALTRAGTTLERVAPAIVDAAADAVARDPMADVDFAALRVRMYDTHLKARMERASATARANVAAAADDDDEATDDESYDSDDEGDGVECGVCENLMPDVYCATCGVGVCDVCHRRGVAPHAKTHAVVPFDESNATHTGRAATLEEEVEEKEKTKAVAAEKAAEQQKKPALSAAQWTAHVRDAAYFAAERAGFALAPDDAWRAGEAEIAARFEKLSL